MKNVAMTLPRLVYPSMTLLSPSPELWSSGDIILAGYLVYCQSSSKLGSNLRSSIPRPGLAQLSVVLRNFLSRSSGVVLFGKLCYVPLYFMLQAAGELATL